MNRILESLCSFFTANCIAFEPSREAPVVKTSFQLRNALFLCRGVSLENEQALIFYTVSPVKVPERARQKAGELVVRANSSVAFGNFELDFEDGEVRFKTSLDVTGSALNDSLIDRLVGLNLSTMDRLFPAVMSVAFGGVSPVHAMMQLQPTPPAERKDCGNARWRWN